MPKGSWLTAMTSGAVSIANVSLDIWVTSQPINKGALERHHKLKGKREKSNKPNKQAKEGNHY